MTTYKILIVEDDNHGLLEHTYTSAEACTDAIQVIGWDLIELGYKAFCVVVGL